MQDPVQRVERWSDPSPMETGAPEPLLVEEGDVLWVAYRARDPLFPGWDAPSVTAYLAANPDELFGVLRFDGVRRHTLGPPSDERLHEHPLYGHGLDFYSFHVAPEPSADTTRRIVTFHDETLEVWAHGAQAYPALRAHGPQESIAKVTCTVDHGAAPAGRSPAAPDYR